MIKRLTALAFTLTLLVAPASAQSKAGAKSRDINSVKKEQKEVTARVKETDRAVSLNTRETERNLNRLSALRRQVAESREAIKASQLSIDSLDRAIATRTDSLRVLETRLSSLKKSFADALRRQQLYPKTNSPLAFIFSARSVTDAYRRMRYLRQYDHWQAVRSNELSRAANAVAEAKQALEGTRAKQAEAHANLNSRRDRLAREEQATDATVAALRKEGKALKEVLAEQQRRSAALDRELDRLIAEEQARQERERRAAEERRRREAEEKRKKAEAEAAAKAAHEKADKDKTAKDKNKGSKGDSGKKDETPKPAVKPAAKPATPPPLDSEAEADRKLTGSFASNKGRLLFPVAGRYRIARGFGLQNHPELKNVKTNNSGIDIEVAPGTDARAVFQGKVSAIFRLPGFANIVMVRHGDYISLYANLSSTYVTKGQEVKAGQSIGRILTQSEEEGGATTFHFELRREREKLNPLEWVK